MYYKITCYLKLIFILLLSGWACETYAGSTQKYDCVMIPSAIVGVGSGAPGVIEEILVDRSDRVKKGQLLAKLESSVEYIDHDLAKVQSEMDTVVKMRKVSVTFNDRNLKRVKSLHKKSMISADLKDKAEREAGLALWRLQDAKDLMMQRKMKFKRAEALLKRRKIFSPVDGIVVARLHHEGEYVDEKPIMTIAQLDPLYVEVVIPLSEYGHIKPGMEANVIPELQLGKVLKAKVKIVDGAGDLASGTFGVRLSLPNPDYKIPAGVKCTVEFPNMTPSLNDKEVNVVN